VVDHAKQRDDRGLVGGDAVEIAHWLDFQDRAARFVRMTNGCQNSAQTTNAKPRVTFLARQLEKARASGSALFIWTAGLSLPIARRA
jgi:hypothetical protein